MVKTVVKYIFQNIIIYYLPIKLDNMPEKVNLPLWKIDSEIIKLAIDSLDDKLFKLSEEGAFTKKEFKLITINIDRIIKSCYNIDKNEESPGWVKILMRKINGLTAVIMSKLDSLTVLSGEEYLEQLKVIEMHRIKLVQKAKPLANY